MTYCEYPINELLKPYVKVVWSVEYDSQIFGGNSTHILPDTCVELVFHFRDPYKATFSDDSVSIQERSFVVAQMKNFMKIEPNGRTGIVAVRLTALGAYHFFDMPMKEITNQEVGLRNVWKDFASDIEEKIQLAKSTSQRSEIIQHYLEIQLSKNGYIDKSIEFCVNEIKQAKGLISIEALADKVGISNRQLVRRFDKCIGLSPKEFGRIIRFISSLDEIRNSTDKNLTEVALHTGYYDQAHFIHDFKEFSGLTPSGYLNSTNVVY